MKNELTLKIDYDLNYILIAIRTKLEDYQFAYSLNKSPLLLFERLQKDICCVINQQNIYFSTFEYINPTLQRTIFLINNRAIYNTKLNSSEGLFRGDEISNTTFLIPELKEFDYFLKLVGIWKSDEINELKTLLHDMKDVESETNIELNTIKSINNLVF